MGAERVSTVNDGGSSSSGREKKGGEVRKVVVENGSETGGLKNFAVWGGSGTQRDKIREARWAWWGKMGEYEKLRCVYSVAMIGAEHRFFLQLCGTSLLAAVVAGHAGWWIGVLYLDLGKWCVGELGNGKYLNREYFRDGLDFKP